MTIIVRMANVVVGTDVMESLERLPPRERSREIAHVLRSAAEKTKLCVFELEFEARGTQLARRSEDKSGMGTESISAGGKEPISCSGKMVTSGKRSYVNLVFGTTQKHRLHDMFDGNQSKSFQYDQNRHVAVSIDCRAAYCPDELQDFCRITGASCWRDTGDRTCSIDPWANYIEALQFEEFKNDSRGQRVAVLGMKHENRPIRELWYFGSFENQLVWIGKEHVSEDRISGDSFGDRIHRTISETKVEYGRVDGHVLPMRWTDNSMSEVLRPDLTPMYDPTELRKCANRITKVKILPEFPEKLLQIPIGNGVQILDNCNDRKQQAIAQEVTQSISRSNWWMLGAGVLLCGIAFLVRRAIRQ